MNLAEANHPVPTNGPLGGFEILLANVPSKQISFLMIINLPSYLNTQSDYILPDLFLPVVGFHLFLISFGTPGT